MSEQFVPPKFDAESWASCTSLWLLARYLGDPKRTPTTSEERKLRLLVVAALNAEWANIPDELKSVVEALERFADCPDLMQLQEARAVAERIFRKGVIGPARLTQTIWCATEERLATPYNPRWCKVMAFIPDAASNAAREAAAVLHLKLFHDIIPNPFRPVAFDPAWCTSDVLLLAQGIYTDRAFERMPILADALQDAGCDNDDILSHCRDATQLHARGCWVVDLVLGKE